MALSTRFSTHLAESMRKFFAAYEAVPMDPEVLRYSQATFPGSTENTLRLTHAMAATAAIALPAYQNLTHACAETPPDNWSRLAHCEDVGRLMATKGDALITQLIGFVVLRKIDRLTDADRELERKRRWVLHQLWRRADARVVDDRDMADWQSIDSEFEIQRRALSRAGISPDPPADWVVPMPSALRPTSAAPATEPTG